MTRIYQSLPESVVLQGEGTLDCHKVFNSFRTLPLTSAQFTHGVSSATWSAVHSCTPCMIMMLKLGLTRCFMHTGGINQDAAHEQLKAAGSALGACPPDYRSDSGLSCSRDQEQWKHLWVRRGLSHRHPSQRSSPGGSGTPAQQRPFPRQIRVIAAP